VASAGRLLAKVISMVSPGEVDSGATIRLEWFAKALKRDCD
jgi:hypothetical protein